jgi:hypothetical protein
MSKVRTAKVLLELLDLATVEQLDVMLRPEVLLELLEAFGQSHDAVGKAAASGVLPGELLRDLLHTHGIEAVWAKVSPTHQREALRATPTPRAGILDRLQSKDRSRLERVAAIGGLTALVWAAMWMAGAFPEWGAGPGLGTAIASCLGGAALFGTLTDPRSAGMIAGFAAGLANVGAAWLWRERLPDVPVGRLAVLAIVLFPLVSGLLSSILLERLVGGGAKPRGF